MDEDTSKIIKTIAAIFIAAILVGGGIYLFISNLTPSVEKIPTTYADFESAIQEEVNQKEKYAYYANVAKSEGFPNLATLFMAIRDGEQVQISSMMDVAISAKVLDKPSPKTFQSGTTANNLETVKAEENVAGFTTYPGFAAHAKAEGFKRAKKVFTKCAAAEQSHGELFSNALVLIQSGTDIAQKDYYICDKCGTVVADKKPFFCPSCRAIGFFALDKYYSD